MPFLGLTPLWGSRWRPHGNDEPSSPDNAADGTDAKAAEKPARSKKEERSPSTDMLLDGIGDYIYEEQLGYGKFSKVRLARHYATEDLYAIKIIDKRSHDKRVMSRLAREIALMEVLEHKNVVRLHQTYETAETLYLVMEYVPGWNLDEYLQSQPEGLMNEHEARSIFRQMVQALDYCHSRWVVHRDLKAPNILLTPQGGVKLADFGLGNRYGLRRLVTICGSMLYYSPEIISGTKYMGPEVDCWCLGVTLFRITAGYEPFAHARTVSELKRDVIQGDYKRPAHISQDLWNTIKKCMHADKRRRVDLKTALAGDAWLNDHGRLPDLFADASQHYQAQRPYPIVQKRVIYHPHVEAIYYTRSTSEEEEAAKDKGVAPTFDKECGQEAVDASRGVLLAQIIADLQLFDLQPTTHLADIQSPIQHLLRKLKRPESMPPSNASQMGRRRSTHSLSQIYNRVAKDQIKYYVLSDPRSRSPESGVVLDMQHSMYGTAFEQDPMQIIRRICDMLGITYRHESKTQLRCVFTMRHPTDKKRAWMYSLRSSHDGMPRASLDSASTPYLAGQDGTRQPTYVSTDTITTAATTTIEPGRPTSSVMSRQSSSSRSNGPRRWSRQLKRLSIPLHSIGSHSFHFHSSTPLYHYQDGGGGSAGGGRTSQTPEKTGDTTEKTTEKTTEATETDPESEKKEKTAVFTIDVSLYPSNKDALEKLIMAIRYSKIKGSSKAFKVATGWIHMTHFCKDYRATPNNQ